MIEVIPLASGSQGNSTLIRTGTTALLVDAGLTRLAMLARLSDAGQDPADLAGILLTHRHKDHCRSAATLCRRFKIPLYGTAQTVEHQQPRTLPTIHEIEEGSRFDIGDVRVHSQILSHDAPQTLGYVFENPTGKERIGLATDLGTWGPGVSGFLSDLDVLMLEFNHDVALLQEGPYPAFLKHRIASDVGHLSNEQAAGLLEDCASPRLQALYLCHLSQHNNTSRLAEQAAGSALEKSRCDPVIVRMADQRAVSEGHKVD